MNTMGISTDPSLLDVELPRTLIESPSVSTFLPEEEASICPLLSSSNCATTPLTFSHPLTPCADQDDDNPVNCLCNDDTKGETSSSSGSSSGIGMDVPDTSATTLFNKLTYQHLQHNPPAIMTQESNCHGNNGNINLSKDAPGFVSWNWPIIRKCTFFGFISSLLAMCGIVVAFIITLPKTCNPTTVWYRGSVFYEIFPASYQDSNSDGVGDIHGIGNRIDYLESMGISAIRLNSIFPSAHFPDDYMNITSLTDVSDVLGGLSDLQQLTETLHARNISLVLDLPIYPFVKELGKVLLPPESSALQTAGVIDGLPSSTTTQGPIIIGDNLIYDAIQKWLDVGVDGFYIKGLEEFAHDENLISNLAFWKSTLGSNRVLIVSEMLINKLDDTKRTAALSHIDLVDVHLEVLNGTEQMEKRIFEVLAGPLAPIADGPWIHWSIGGVEKERITRHYEGSNVTLAATIMQLMLPGTPSIFYGDEIALESVNDPRNEHIETKHLHHLPTMQWHNTSHQFTGRNTLPWLPKTSSYTFENFQLISEMIKLRDRSPSIYKNAICKVETTQPNTQVLRSHDDILVVERVYPRRNSFVSISNFALNRVHMDLTTLYYSGVKMVPKVSNEKIFFGNLEVGPLQTIVVKLDK